jgi:predicted acyl esterase
MTPVVLDIKHECHESLPGGLMYQTPECVTDTSAQPGRFLQSTTRGFLDSRYRKGLSKQVMFEPGKPFAATIPMKPIDYIFKKGHSIGLNLMSENIECVVAKLPNEPPPIDKCDPADQGTPCARFFVEWTTNRNQLILPIVGGPKDPAELFGHHNMSGM